jgi:hypothetical protein
MGLEQLLGLNLSEFVEECLKNGVVPVLQFASKDSVSTGVEEPNVSRHDRNPVQVLESEIKFFKAFQIKIETRADIEIDPDKKEEAEKKLNQLHTELSGKIAEFKAAIELLKQSS